MIHIRYEYSQSGDAQPHLLESFGPVIENQSHVELWIRRAQAAVLSPHRPRSDFLTMSESEIRENARTDAAILPFSKNVVQVSLNDPNATDLSFVDLPGKVSYLIYLSAFCLYLKKCRVNSECRGGSHQYGTIVGGEPCCKEEYHNCHRYAYERWVTPVHINLKACAKLLILDDIEMMQAVVIASKSDPEKARTVGS
jgi:hypothetical protein